MTSFTYDPWGRPVTVVDPLGHTTHQAFDLADRLRRVTDPLGGVLDTTFDDHGRIRSRDRAGAGTVYVAYTPNQSYKSTAGLWRVDRWDDQDAVNGVATQFNAQWDLNFTSLK